MYYFATKILLILFFKIGIPFTWSEIQKVQMEYNAVSSSYHSTVPSAHPRAAQLYKTRQSVVVTLLLLRSLVLLSSCVQTHIHTTHLYIHSVHSECGQLASQLLKNLASVSDYYLLSHKVSTFLWPLSIHEMISKSLLSLHLSVAPLSVFFCPIPLLWMAWQGDGR